MKTFNFVLSGQFGEMAKRMNSCAHGREFEPYCTSMHFFGFVCNLSKF